MAKYFTILTNLGSALHANAQIQQTTVPWTHMALGDGNGAEVNPNQAQTGLVREVHRLPITAIEQHATNPNWIVVEAVVPNSVGGWTVRETAIFGGAGAAQCIAVGNYPATYKPVLAEGAVREMVMRMIVEISSTATVNLVIDPAVAIASRAYVDNSLQAELVKRDHKQVVRVATTANIALTGLQNIDAVALAVGDRVLVKDQADAKDNGIYVAAFGVWARATDADKAAKLNAGAIVPVTEGTLHADTLWTLRTDGAIVPGITAQAWQWMAGANAPNQTVGDNSRKVANTAFVNRAVSDVVGGHMFEISQWMGSREAIAQGWFSMDGVQVSELLVPGIRDAITASGHSIVTETVWQTDPLKRGAWSSGAAGWVRMPDWNGVQAGSIGGLYFSGDLGGGRHGTVVSDAIRNIVGTSFRSVAATAVAEQGQVSGPFAGTEFYDKYPEFAAIQNTTVPGSAYPRSINFDASRAVPTAAENRPKTVYGTWIMRLYGSITNVGSLDASALNARMNLIDERVATLEGRKKALGDGQTRKVMGRTSGVSYVNNTGRVINVSASGSSNAANGQIYINVSPNGTTWRQVAFVIAPNSGTTISINADILDGERYSINAVSISSLVVQEITNA